MTERYYIVKYCQKNQSYLSTVTLLLIHAVFYRTLEFIAAPYNLHGPEPLLTNKPFQA
jgi:hypothetical protein